MRLPPIQRTADDRLLLGVCAGVARGFGVDPLLVRLAFAALAVLGSGAGVLLYGALALLPAESGPAVPWAARSRAALGLVGLVGLLTAGLVLGLVDLPLSALVPSALLVLGVALVWREVTTGRDADDGPDRRLLTRVGAGLALLVGGAVTFLLNADRLASLSAALVAGAVVAAGLGLIVGPQLVRARAEADAERRARIRADEQADVAARLHDSVLQTLALIQREDDPRRSQALARGQERELRAWLYGGAAPDGPGTIAGALRAAAAEVEEHHGVVVDLVQPSDGPLDEGLTALAGAAREAMLNAARHAGVGEVSVLVRVGDAEASVFVRDRGRGFDPDAVAEDRRGVRESIVGRMRRCGGTATVVSAPGAGTEVELLLPRTDT